MSDLLDRGEAALGIDDLGDAEDLDRSRCGQLYVLDLLRSQPVKFLVLLLLLLLQLCSQLVTLVHNEAHLARSSPVLLIFLGYRVDVQVKTEELGQRLLAKHSLSLQIALLDVLRGQTFRPELVS